MVEESSPLLPLTEESIEAETETALEPEPESGELTPEPTSEPGFVCDCEASMRSACQGLPFYKEHESRRYCVLHYPGKEKSGDFKAALDSKLNNKDFDFQGVWFPVAADFEKRNFETKVDFSKATFEGYANFFGARFVEANFYRATFSEYADFALARFAQVIFTEAKFNQSADFFKTRFCKKAFFYGTKFNRDAIFSESEFESASDFSQGEFEANVVFTKARFADVDFVGATFSGTAKFWSATFNAFVNFSGATFADLVRFLGDETFGGLSSLDLQFSRAEKPDLVSFQSLTLRPHWFVNVDPRKFVLTDVDWKWDAISIETEIDALGKKEVASPDRLLEIACRQLADNAEANNRYEEASRFRYWAMECRRQEQWPGFSFWKQFWNQAMAALTQLKEYRILSPFTRNWLHWLYWVFSGYGERIRRCLAWLIVIWIVFAVFYTRVGFTQPAQQSFTEGTAAVIIEDKIGQPLEFSRALTYSLAVMSLQKPEPKPLTGTAQTLVLLETILGPVQAALLALAIRRKFMR